MHGFIRNRLEDLLQAPPLRTEAGDSADHLANCSECASELNLMKEQSALLQTLRAPEDAEPAPGFYARVLQRIEERAKESIWASLLSSPLSSRIAYACLTLALMAGSYVIASESRDGHLSGHVLVAQMQPHEDVVVEGNASEQRDAVLENFASH